jgi:hypothetical protein
MKKDTTIATISWLLYKTRRNIDRIINSNTFTMYDRIVSIRCQGHCVVLYWFVFVLCLVYPMLPFSLDCPFLITLPVFSGLSILDYPSNFLWIVHSWLPLRFFLDCPFLITPPVFSGLSILDYPSGFLWIVHSWLPLRFSLGCPFLITPRVSLDCPFLITPPVFPNVYL